MAPKKRKRKMLTLQFIPYRDIESLSGEERIKKLLKIVKDEKIILLEGKLKPEEETLLIKRTMEQISPTFKGIEISPLNVHSKKDQALYHKYKEILIGFLLGNRQGLTIIGPATIVKEIRADPDKIQLLMEDMSKKKRKR
ncbi:DUF2073 domain-containing protein [Candidatus Woesearchaeota archaeon]|nr:DUF2073 domain-containing protein [Candidatus Woesearchaeota archaeon]